MTMEGDRTRNGKIVSILVATLFIFLSFSMIPIINASATSGYVYAPHQIVANPSINYDDGIVWPGANFTTDWGWANFYGGAQTSWFGEWGGFGFDGYNIDLKNYAQQATVQYYNDTYQVGRPFNNNYSANLTYLQNNAQFVVVERYATNSAWGWMKAGEWSTIERLTINKHEPIMKMDVWVKNLNASSKVKLFNEYILYPNTWGTAHTIVSDPMRALTTYTHDLGYYSIGLIGFGQSVGGGYGGASEMNLNNWSLSAWRHDLSTELHGSMMLVLGADLVDVNALADQIGDSWNEDFDRDSFDLVTAQNLISNEYDAYKFFNASTLIYPSGTTEKIVINGINSTLSLNDIPIENYKRDPFLLTHDDHAYENYTSLYSHIFNLTRKYEIHWTLNLNPNQPWNPDIGNGAIHEDSVLELYEQKSWAYYGTQLEIGNHGYNHSVAGPTVAEAYNQAKLCNDRWIAISPNSTTSMVLPGNSWGYGTTEGVAQAGIKNLRMGYVFGGGDSTLTHDEYGVLVYSWHYSTMDIDAANWTGITKSASGYGQSVVQSHQLDFSMDTTNHNIENLFSWIQNSSDLISLTQGQFYDLRHGLLNYSAGGTTTISLSDSTDDHAIWLDKSMMGRMQFRDVDTGELAKTKNFGNFTILYAQKGHTYISVYSQAIVNLGALIGIMMALGVFVSVLVPIVQVAQEKRKFKPDDFIHMVIYIVTSIGLLGMVYAILP